MSSVSICLISGKEVPGKMHRNPKGTSPKQVVVPECATVDPSAILGEKVKFGENVTIGAQATVSESTLDSGVVLSEESCVLGSTLGTDAVIGSKAEVEYSFVGSNVQVGSINHIRYAKIGNNVCLKKAVSIEGISDSPVDIGAESILSNGCRLSGFISLGHCSILNTGVTLEDGVFIGAYTLIGGDSVLSHVECKSRVRIGTGCSLQGAKISDDVSIGNHVVLNPFGKDDEIHKITLEHGVAIGDGVNISFGTSIGVDTAVGKKVFIGPDVSVGKNVDILADSKLFHSVVVEDDVTICRYTVVSGDVHLLKGAVIARKAELFQKSVVGSDAFVGYNAKIADEQILPADGVIPKGKKLTGISLVLDD